MTFVVEVLRSYMPFKVKSHSAKYHILQGTDSYISSLRSSVITTHAKLFSFIAGFTAASIAILLISLNINSLSSTADKATAIEAEEWNYCGRSSKVAIERGCVMEPLFYGWMPPQCSWKQFSDHWPVFEDRTWYSDFNLTLPIQEDDLWTGKHAHIYTQKYLHVLAS